MTRDLQEETTAVLQRLVRFNTVNPPGNERAAIEYLAGYLGEAGFETEMLGTSDERPNLIADLESAEPGPTLCYLGHVDTVLADPSDWQHDPWSGDVVDGYLWGRGRARHEVPGRRRGGRRRGAGARAGGARRAAR